jgi:hypothetical protein
VAKVMGSVKDSNRTTSPAGIENYSKLGFFPVFCGVNNGQSGVMWPQSKRVSPWLR